MPPPIVAEQTSTPASASLLQSAFPGFLRAPWSHELHPASVGLSVHSTHPTHFWSLSSLPQSGCSQAARGQLSWPGLQPPGWLRATASEWLSRPEAYLRGFAGPLLLPRWQLVCTGSWALPASPTSAVYLCGEPTPGRVPGRRLSLKCLPPRHTAALGHLLGVPRAGLPWGLLSRGKEASAMTCS